MRIRRGATYNITTTVTNGTYSGDTTITDTATVTITADSGYNLPDTVTVTGASQSWNKETGTLTLSNPTGAVTVAAVCVAVQTGETWVLNSSISGGSEIFNNLSFVCDSLQYDSIYVTTDDGSVSDVTYDNSSTHSFLSAYNGDSGWHEQVYRTLTFSTPPTGDLLTWLQANGAKQ